MIELRRDFRDAEGVLHDGDEPEVRVKVVAVRRYKTFLEMVTAEGFERVIPGADSAEAAASEYEKYYSPREQAEFGVLAVEVKIKV